VAQAVGMNQSLGNNVADNLSPTFASDTAEKAGLTDRSIQRSIRRAKKIEPAVSDRVRAMPEQPSVNHLRRSFISFQEDRSKNDCFPDGSVGSTTPA
jgi:hypothetical protein